MHIAVGQLWADKDKRRPRKGEVLAIEDNYVTLLVVGAETGTKVRNDVLAKRWDLIKDAEHLIDVPATPHNWQLKAVCIVDPEGQIIRLSQRQASRGMPLCGCHHKEMKLVQKH